MDTPTVPKIRPHSNVAFELVPGGKLPVKGDNPGDIGLDFFSRTEVIIPCMTSVTRVTPVRCVTDAEYDMPVDVDQISKAHKEQLNRRLVPLGVKYQPDMGCGFLQLLPRSGLATKGLDIGAGVIDAGYRGEIHALVINTNPFPIRIPAGTKIVQGVWQMAAVPSEIVAVESVSATQRGDGGFGSSGM